MTFIDWTIIAVFLIGLTLIGFLFSKSNRNLEDYFLGGRSMPTWLVAFAATGTSISAGTFVGSPELGFNTNLTYLMLCVGAILGGTLVALLVLPKLYNANTITIYGYLGDRFGERHVPRRAALHVGFAALHRRDRRVGDSLRQHPVRVPDVFDHHSGCRQYRLHHGGRHQGADLHRYDPDHAGHRHGRRGAVVHLFLDDAPHEPRRHLRYARFGRSQECGGRVGRRQQVADRRCVVAHGRAL